jgi:hypothetical protein
MKKPKIKKNRKYTSIQFITIILLFFVSYAHAEYIIADGDTIISSLVWLEAGNKHHIVVDDGQNVTIRELEWYEGRIFDICVYGIDGGSQTYSLVRIRGFIEIGGTHYIKILTHSKSIVYLPIKRIVYIEELYNENNN